jgi:GNAT superfamily N-acetyltransferase
LKEQSEMPDLDLPNGYYDLPKGKLANVVTCLEMFSNPLRGPKALPEGLTLRVIDSNDLVAYRALFRKVGEPYMWQSRIAMSDEKLQSTLGDPEVQSFALLKGDETFGILELDFREMPNCELAFFGLVPEAVGLGLGRALMNVAISKAWEKPINRLWVHTCHFDHPKAMQFYQRSGFKAYKLMVELHDDPRLQGKLSKSASPHVALIE